MLSAKENQELCEVGPGTLMGDLIRQYWIPSLVPSEVPEPDSPPVRLRLLGENLIAFRATSGAVGVLANACPHRGASLFFGRNEEEGLRCVYHGWKFDVNGACVDMPSEPAESNFKSKVRAKAYPSVERNGIIWTYMGPRAVPPPLPDVRPNLESACTVLKFVQNCNFMQAVEGDIDTVHWGFSTAATSARKTAFLTARITLLPKSTPSNPSLSSTGSAPPTARTGPALRHRTVGASAASCFPSTRRRRRAR